MCYYSPLFSKMYKNGKARKRQSSFFKLNLERGHPYALHSTNIDFFFSVFSLIKRYNTTKKFWSTAISNEK